MLGTIQDRRLAVIRDAANTRELGDVGRFRESWAERQLNNGRRVFEAKRLAPRHGFAPRFTAPKVAVQRREGIDPHPLAFVGLHGLKIGFGNYDCVLRMMFRLAWIF